MKKNKEFLIPLWAIITAIVLVSFTLITAFSVKITMTIHNAKLSNVYGSDSNNTDFTEPKITYEVYRDGIGFVDGTLQEKDGQNFSGIKIFSIKVSIDNGSVSDGDVEYEAKFKENYTWSDTCIGGEAVPTIADSICAIKARLTGRIAELYDISYTMHKIGDTNENTVGINGESEGINGSELDLGQVDVDKITFSLKAKQNNGGDNIAPTTEKNTGFVDSKLTYEVYRDGIGFVDGTIQEKDGQRQERRFGRE